jgi:hypothetical protein
VRNGMKNIIVILSIISLTISAQTKFTEISSMPGAFSRMGFGARGIGMGNAVSAVNQGNTSSYYNPALVVFQEDNTFQTAYSFLSLNRSLNFLSFSKRFEFGKKEDESGNIKPRSVAGISAGIINSGVSKIDGRDNQGNKTAEYSTSENQFFIAVGNKFSEKFSLGVAFKFYYYKLFEGLSSNGFGIDIGTFYSITNAIKFSFVLSDINSKYEWDTGGIYGSSGTTSKDKFPLLKKIGLSYKFDDPNILAAVEFESSNAGTNYIKVGTEYNIIPDLFLRCGVDKLNLSNTETPIRPSIGLSYFYNVSSFRFGFEYAFVIEPYAVGDQHIIGLYFNF